MPPPFVDDIPDFFADFAVPCVSGANGYAFKGLLDTPDEALSLGGVHMLSTMYLVTAPTTDTTAAALATGVALTVDGVAYVVRDVMLQSDGALTQVSLSR